MKTKTTYSEAKKALTELTSTIDLDMSDAKIAYAEMNDETLDFEAENYRFIHKDNIDIVMCEELESDHYLLGSFTDYFIADILDTTVEAIKAMQKAGSYEEIGMMMLEHINEIQEEYVRLDGYGNHFGTYDGEEHEIGNYHVFRIN